MSAFQKHNMDDYRPMSYSSVNDWQYQEKMKYLNIVKDDAADYKPLRMIFFDIDKTNGDRVNPKFEIEPHLFSTYFDHKRPIYIVCETICAENPSYSDPLHLFWVNPPFDSRSSWSSSYNSEINTLCLLQSFLPTDRIQQKSINNKVGAYKTTLHQLQSRNEWEFLIGSESLEKAQLGTGYDIRSYNFTLFLWQE